jgi:hypothetical protein
VIIQAAEIERREKAFAETLRESLAAVTKAKDAELAAIQADFLSKSVEKEAELEKARLDFQSKLTAANKMFEQQVWHNCIVAFTFNHTCPVQKFR